MTAVRARVILLAGPSGSGKTSLAARTGLPVLRLDHFYKDADAPDLPMLPGGHGAGVGAAVDWDDPKSWNADAALAAITALCTHGRADIPVYDISASAATGRTRLDLAGASAFVAEGIFAAGITTRCRERGLLADALCLRGRPSTTARRRFVRDLREGRKSVPFLVRRGLHLMRAERGIVARDVALGCHPCDHAEARARIDAVLREPVAAEAA